MFVGGDPGRVVRAETILCELGFREKRESGYNGEGIAV